MSDDLMEREYLIFKSGRGWYRPESQGYTSFKFDAGRYTEQEAISITHPNGEDGSRDGMFFKHENEVSDYPSDRIAELETKLAKAVDALSALEKAASEVSRRGAETGPQWTKLTCAIIPARATLAELTGGNDE